MNPSGLLALIDIDLKNDMALAEDCKRIVNFFALRPEDMGRHLTFKMLADILKADGISSVIRPVEYLSGVQINFLNPVFEFIDDEDEIYKISDSDFSYIDGVRRFYHPETGCLVPDYEKKILLSYEINQACSHVDWGRDDKR